jgi:hypothetical protein
VRGRLLLLALMASSAFAADNAVERGLDKAGKAIERGAKAAGRGVDHAAGAVNRTLKKGHDKVDERVRTEKKKEQEK